MRIATKLNVGILAVFVASVLANFLVLQATIKPQFESIEIQASRANHKRVLDALESLQAKIRTSTQDWGFWDDTYSFATGEAVDTYVQSNLIDPKNAMDGLAIDTLIFFDTKGSVLWGKAIDLSTKEDIASIVDDLKAFNYIHPYLQGSGQAVAHSGLVRTSRGLMLMASAPILKSDRTGVPMGTVVMGSFLNETAVQELTGVKFQLNADLEKIPGSTDGLTLRQRAHAIETTSLILDISRAPLARLVAETPRDVTVAATAALRSATWLSIAAAAAVIAALWLLVNSIVVAPVMALQKHFERASYKGQLRQTAAQYANDEIGHLAKSFNHMTEQVNHLRDALADTAYLAGISEWAAGSLHNVRNGLSPINVAAWRTQSLFEQPWLNNMKAAVEQISDKETSPNRRDKLVEFIVGKTPLLLDCADQARKISQEIMSASKSVEEIASGYSKFSRREMELEPLELLPIVENVARATMGSLAPKVELTLPTGSAVIVGNKTLIRQILGNILTNSVEAMNGEFEGKAIRVDLRPNPDAADSVRVSVSDNGEGILPEHLKQIFERGFSTRGHKIGGLGLHWCANAAKEMGGTLHAESQGRGTGTTLVLNLPTTIQKRNVVEEAA